MSTPQASAAGLFQQAQHHHQAGQLQQAELLYRQVLTLTPQHHEALNLLGEIAGASGRTDEALALIGAAVQLKPSAPHYHYNLAVALIGAARFEEAARHLRRTIRKKPDFAAAHCNLAGVLHQLGHWEQAVASCRNALRADQNFAQAYLNLGTSLRMLEQMDAAVASYRNALRMDPTLPGLHTSLGGALREVGLYAESEAICREAIRVNPSDMEAHYALGYLLLLMGRLEEGWEGFETRRQISRLKPLHLPQPLWDGSHLPEARIFVHAEEGLGDTLQFCRFVPHLAKRARIILAAPPALTRLFLELPGVEQLVAPGDVAPAFDMHLPLLSAPHVLGTTLETIPAAVPYLQADPSLAADWRERLQALPGLRVGLAWAGNPGQMNDRRRSIALGRLAALADVAGVSFVSLQKGEAALQARAAPGGMILHDWTSELGDLADTAALIAGLDLVISVDTSIVHLTGALGKPVWLMNRFDTDWRWLLDRDDSPWYPTLRQFRQQRLGDWDTVIHALRDALVQWVAETGRADRHHTVVLPPKIDPRPEKDRDAKITPPAVIADLLQRGIADHTSGHLDRAEQTYRQILAAVPAHSDGQHLLGILLHQTGRSEEAIKAIELAIKLQPSTVHYRNNLGNILRDIGRAKEASACYLRALRLQPSFPDLHHNLGKALVELEDYKEAEAAFRRALQLRPDYFDAYNDLGNLLTQVGRASDALDLFKTALQLDPASPVVRNNMGLALINLHRDAEAADSFRAALKLQPDYGKALVNLAKVLTVLGQWHNAAECFHNALQLLPDDAEVHVCHGMMLLLTGRLEDGWPDMEWIHAVPKDNAAALTMKFPPRTWKGDNIGDNTLVIYADQGFGDTIQFSRYVQLCIPLANVVLVSPPALSPLLSRIEGVTHFLDGMILPESHVHCPVTALPGIFKTSLDTIPNAVPYLRADDVKIAAWRRRIAPLAGLRVGLVWGGNPKYANDRTRSVSFERLTKLAGIPGVVFISLQKGAAAADAKAFHAVMPVHDWTDELQDFDDTAALVEALDLVISVDTSVVHLAGALGKPVWLLNRFDTDWRWLLNRDDSPWYPTLRQFRQPKAGDWESVLSRVRDALIHMTSRDLESPKSLSIQNPLDAQLTGAASDG